MEGKKANLQSNSSTKLIPVLKDCATLIDCQPSDSAFTACQPLEAKQVSTLRTFCCSNTNEEEEKLKYIPSTEPDDEKHYLLKCTDGIFEGKFLYINTTPDGELFGSGDPEEN
jgi:hypothetical protein